MIPIITNPTTKQTRNSAQRTAILADIKSRRDHPTAISVHESVRKSHPKLSLGTTYRILNSLAASGEILRLPMPDGADRYDGQTHDHQHAFCSCCAKIIDAKLPPSRLKLLQFTHQTKFAIEQLRTCMIGKCNTCQCGTKGETKCPN